MLLGLRQGSKNDNRQQGLNEASAPSDPLLDWWFQMQPESGRHVDLHGLQAVTPTQEKQLLGSGWHE
jgi:hypothetical protein